MILSPKRLAYLAVAVLVGAVCYTSLLSRSAVKADHSRDMIRAKDVRLAQLAQQNDSLKHHTAKAETVYVYRKAASDARAAKTTADADTALSLVRATGDTAATKAVSRLTMDLVLERRERGQERDAADSVIAGKTQEIKNLTEQLATVVSRAEDQRRMDHRAILREKARGGVAVASASGGAIIGAVVAGPIGAGIGAAVGGIAALVVGR